MLRGILPAGAAALGLFFGILVLAGGSPSEAQPAPAPSARASAAPRAGPTPYPEVSFPPASRPTSLPYPAYGSPVPGVGGGALAPGVPQVITLQNAIAIGFAKAPALAAARADQGVAAAGVRLARAGILPSLSATATSGRNFQEQLGSVGGGRLTGASSAITTSFALRQLVFDGGRVASQIRAAQRNETGFADQYRRQLQTVAFNVATAYYNALSAQRSTLVAVESVRNAQVQEDLVGAQVRAGTAARADLATAQLPTAQGRLAVVRAQGAEFSAQAAFANAMGLDANTLVAPADDTPVFTTAAIKTIEIPTYEHAITRALALRPDFDAVVQQVQGATSTLRAARLGRTPAVSLQGTTGTSSTDVSAGSFRNSSSIGLQLNVPLYDQGLTAANSAQAQAQLDKAQANLDTTRLGIQLAVKQALINLVSARAAVDQAQAEFTKAQEVLRATQAQYRAGVTTLPLLLNAQVQLTQALTDQVTAVYGLRQAEQSLLFATGANSP